ncbi:MAG TPA: ABC transporter substrate-binding protein [Stellaceae bacterium]|nr:ABC transporter substrate-binding protein [Stellaceae bacterium]
MRRAVGALGLGTLLGLAGLSAPSADAAETIKIGMQKPVGGPLYIADAKGYYAAEGLTPDYVFFEAGEPIAVAVASGAVDFGVAGLTGGFYSLAGKGALKIIAGQTHEMPGFPANTVAASNKAFEGGLKSVKDLPGHSVAITQIGSAFHYDLGLLAAKYEFDLQTIRLMPLQTNPNAVAAVVGNSADAVVTIAPWVAPAINKGDAKLLAYIGDESPWQLAVAFTGTKTANDQPEKVKHFVAALRRATRDYHDAFTGSDGKRADQASAPELLAILAKYTGQKPEVIDQGLGYMDAEARLDEADVLKQVTWYRAQGMVKDDFDAASIIDKRYAVPLNK